MGPSGCVLSYNKVRLRNSMLQCITILKMSSTNHWCSRQTEIIAIRPIMLFDKSPEE